MSNAFCLDCGEKKNCKAICKPLESYLNKLQADNGYSDRHYRRKMIPWDSHLIEYKATKRAMELKYGKKWVERQYRKTEE